MIELMKSKAKKFAIKSLQERGEDEEADRA